MNSLGIKEIGFLDCPGQWKAGGETAFWGEGLAPRCHHPLRMKDRLYVSYWHHATNDVTIDDRGLIYIIDRVRGMHIVERI